MPSTSGLFTLGQAVKSRITSVDTEKHRITASIRQAAPTFQTPIDVSSVQPNSTVSGTVTAVHGDNVVLELDEPKGARALLSVSNLANARGTGVAQLRATLEDAEDERVEGLTVMSVNADKALVIVSASKPKSTKPATTSNNKAVRVRDLSEGQVVSGRVTGPMAGGLGVRISKYVVGRLHPTDVSDDFKGALASPPVEGKVVDVAIVRVDKDLKRVDVSMRASRVQPEAQGEVVDKELKSVEELKVGQKVRGFVKSVAQHGIFVLLGRDLDARVQIRELFDEVRIFGSYAPVRLLVLD